MKVGIMGGTFDPIHIGHMLAAECARDAYDLEEVWFMPSHIPPHKEDAGVTGLMRLEMTAEAIAGHPSFRTLDWEVKRGGVSYTVDTVRELRDAYPEHDFYFIIGADMVAYLPKWNRIGELAEMLTFIGLNRPGTELSVDDLPDFLQKAVVTAEMPLIEISSTIIRSRAASGSSIRYMVPDRVYDYIVRSGIYGLQP
ncbi:nicotinate-nucleotide adenylyltransferase [Paenibacillus sp. cl141a]|uniref:nicotinate-nucleotide adenylyltransferase n=1 Tax=Paenibacillus TaxID=44249 RepID=UPI0008D04C77|nr:MULTISPECIES: nicotinate-nucleotide adenylyltransferase [Paenibacillus]PCL94262.1 nicotinate-nucleotide adenylyltransferase [Paenibacillus lautus]QOT07852.1 nicotinate-nucleotide adenylyltransferase [Paenibacillus sp. JNUCC-32]WFB60367.1 nicotinate-nucleotide adenylyltransferase [Paenibacillus sp. BR1-192]SEM14442.1 nicotinate-nucleotide adenylyltransferase [Paenibacillus sp. cl141a]GIP01750.1 putative nicotinate-nucleotide adenylyltransferase [Paenibacillus lautus]